MSPVSPTPTPAPTPKPGDWMKSTAWLAPIGHVGWGALFTIIAAFLGGLHVAFIVAAVLFVVIAIKEYLIDPRVETDENAVSGTWDLVGWTVGILLALLIAYLKLR